MCQPTPQGAPFATFTRGTLIFFAVVQVGALGFLLQHLQTSGFIEVPSWVPFMNRNNCGLYKPLEYIVTSRRVVTPDGTFPAAGQLQRDRPRSVNPSLSKHAAYVCCVEMMRTMDCRSIHYSWTW